MLNKTLQDNAVHVPGHKMKASDTVHALKESFAGYNRNTYTTLCKRKRYSIARVTHDERLVTCEACLAYLKGEVRPC